MRSIKSLALCSIAAALLVACGGGGNGNQAPKIAFSSMVTFGDSLSDVGTYAVSGIADAGGGKYTVNSASAKNWTELIAAQLGLSAPCAAETGLDGSSFVADPRAAPTFHTGCLNYAQGGARVTNGIGPGNKNIPTYATLGQLTIPVVTQVSRHLGIVGGTFSGTEVITVAAGANDLFMNLAGVSSAAGGGGTAVGAAILAGWDNGVQAAVGPGGVGATSAAITAAVTAMGTAGAQLAALINTQMVAKGAKYVVVSNMPDVSKTPMALGYDVDTRALINTMVTTFNTQLVNGLASTAGVTIVDAYTSNRDQSANPSQYGLTNVTTPACDTAYPANILAGSSLACTTSNVIAGDVSHYLFADNVHPTPFGYQLFAQLVTNKMIAAGWL